MSKQYTIVDEFNVKNSKIIVLNERLNVEDMKHNNIVVDDVIMAYCLTHNEKWLLVNSIHQFKGKKITFAN